MGIFHCIPRIRRQAAVHLHPRGRQLASPLQMDICSGRGWGIEAQLLLVRRSIFFRDKFTAGELGIAVARRGLEVKPNRFWEGCNKIDQSPRHLHRHAGVLEHHHRRRPLRHRTALLTAPNRARLLCSAWESEGGRRREQGRPRKVYCAARPLCG
jgi:hypothetical protein